MGGSNIQDKIEGASAGLGWLERLLELRGRYGFFGILQGLLLLFITGLLVLLLFNPGIVMGIYTRYVETEHSVAIERRFKADADLHVILREMLVRFDADRAYIVELHNGSKNLGSGLPFVKGDMRIEEVRDNVLHVDTEYKEFSLSMFSFISYLFTNGVYIGAVSDMQAVDSRLYYKFMSNDVRGVACIALYYGRMPLGILGLSWCGREMPSFDDKVHVFRGYSTQVATILSDLHMDLD